MDRRARLALLAIACGLGVVEPRPVGGEGAQSEPHPAVASPPLAGFHERLRRLEAGEATQLHVLMIGDSHTASDHLSGRLRALLQQRFGNGGRGLLLPGVPHAHYRPHQMSVTQSGDWRLLTSNKGQPDPMHFGLTGQVMRGDGEGAIAIEDRTGAEAAWFEVDYLARPDGGSLDVVLDGQPYGRIDTRAPPPALVRIEARGRRMELRLAGGGPVDLTGVRHVARDRGVVLSSLGFIGAQVSIIGRWHAETVRRQIGELDPALVILAFGTNEGFSPAARVEGAYARELDRRIAQLKEAAPRASLVIVGPPDANRYPRFCLPPPKVAWEKLPEPRNGRAPLPADAGPPPAPGGTPEPAPEEPVAARPPSEGAAAERATTGEATSPATPGAAAEPAQKPVEPQTKPGWKRTLVWPDPPADAACRPLDADERRTYDDLVADKDRRLCRWHTPSAIAVVRRIQRAAAGRHGALFFDWFELLEGECGADRWTRRGLAHKDRVHFKADGYALAADRLHAALLAGYGKRR